MCLQREPLAVDLADNALARILQLDRDLLVGTSDQDVERRFARQGDRLLKAHHDLRTSLSQLPRQLELEVRLRMEHRSSRSQNAHQLRDIKVHRARTV